MATSSYQILARYEGTYKSRVRCTSDIRQREREALSTSRVETKLLQMLKKRNLQIASEDDDSIYDEDHYQGYDVVDYCTPSDSFTTSCWYSDGWSCHPPSDAPSPALSNESDYCSTTTSLECASQSRRLAQPKSRKENLLNRKRVQRACYNLDSIRREYQSLKMYISQNCDQPEVVSFIVCGRWTTLADAIDNNDENLSKDGLNFLSNIISHNLVKMTDILFILQQGLLLSLKNTVSRLGSQQADVIALISTIVRADPNATPYMIELMSDSQIMNLFDELLSTGTEQEAQTVAELYTILFQLLNNLNSSATFTPTVPCTISESTSLGKIADLYSPMKSFKRIVRPGLIDHLISRFFNQVGIVREDLIRLVVALTANCLSLTYAQLLSAAHDNQWADSVMKVFYQSQLDQMIARSLNGNAIKSCSNSLRLELSQFLEYYHQITIAISCQLLPRC